MTMKDQRDNVPHSIPRRWGVSRVWVLVAFVLGLSPIGASMWFRGNARFGKESAFPPKQFTWCQSKAFLSWRSLR